MRSGASELSASPDCGAMAPSALVFNKSDRAYAAQLQTLAINLYKCIPCPPGVLTPDTDTLTCEASAMLLTVVRNTWSINKK